MSTVYRVKYLGGFCRLYGREYYTDLGWYEVNETTYMSVRNAPDWEVEGLEESAEETVEEVVEELVEEVVEETTEEAEEEVEEEAEEEISESTSWGTAKQAMIARGITEPTDQQISDYITRMGLE